MNSRNFATVLICCWTTTGVPGLIAASACIVQVQTWHSSHLYTCSPCTVQQSHTVDAFCIASKLLVISALYLERVRIAHAHTPNQRSLDMLPLAHQQAAGALARNIRYVTSHIAHVSSSTQPSARSSNRKSNSSVISSTTASAAAAVPGVVQDEQGHLPHVSVLLQEVLENLNHMPIKVINISPSGCGLPSLPGCLWT